MPGLPVQLDHLVYAVPDLAAAQAELEEQLGLPLLPGGRHLEWGTRNAILPLSATSYLEVIGPDPESSRPSLPEVFGIGGLRAPQLVTWAARGTDLAGLCARARDAGVELGMPRPGSRLLGDGATLSWEMTDPLQPRAGGVVPFFINWLRGAHPAAGAEAEAELLGFAAEHPEPDVVAGQLRSLGITLDITRGPAPALVATLQTRDGALDLR